MTVLVCFKVGICLTYWNRFQLVLLLSCPPCNLMSLRNQKDYFKKYKSDRIMLLLKILQRHLSTSSQPPCYWALLGCKSLCHLFDLLLTLSFMTGHLTLYHSHIAGVFSPHTPFTLLPLEKNVLQICMWLLLFISSISSFGWPFFSTVFHN